MTFRDGLYYFAHPYTQKDNNGKYVHRGEILNFEQCCMRSAKLIELGFLIYSPISHTHPIHISWPPFVEGQVHNFWYEFDNEFIKIIPFRGIILAPGWELSQGCIAEKAMFEGLGREVLYYSDIVTI